MEDLADLLRGFAAILKAIVWPAALLTVLVLLRREMSDVVFAIARKIERASKIKITRSGFELIEEIVRRSFATHGPDGPAGETKAAEFERLAARYDSLPRMDRSAQIAERQRLADRLGHLATSLPRQSLVESSSEGKIAALATAIVLKPRARDLLVLEQAARVADYNFTRYRIVLALIAVLARSAASRENLRRAAAILWAAEYRERVQTDPSLQRLIDKAREAVGDFAGGSDILAELGSDASPHRVSVEGTKTDADASGPTSSPGP